jgi:multidrug efflux pump subunit AcrA (membrane-fusion protein)
VPKSAIQQQDGKDVVWVVQNGRAERRAVTVSLTVGEDTQLGAGVAAGEKVVAKVPTGLTGGTKLKEIKP